jgi:hypothetical protein
VVDRLELPRNLRDRFQHRLRRIAAREWLHAAAIAVDPVARGPNIAERFIGAARQAHHRNLVARAEWRHQNGRNLLHRRRAGDRDADIVHQQHHAPRIVWIRSAERLHSGERLHLDRVAVFLDRELALTEIGDRSVVAIEHDDVELDEVSGPGRRLPLRGDADGEDGDQRRDDPLLHRCALRMTAIARLVTL